GAVAAVLALAGVAAAVSAALAAPVSVAGASASAALSSQEESEPRLMKKDMESLRWLEGQQFFQRAFHPFLDGVLHALLRGLGGTFGRRHLLRIGAAQGRIGA